MQGIMEEFEAGNIYIICVYGRHAHMTSSIENKLQNPSNSFLRISCWSYPRACTRKQVHVRVYTRIYVYVCTRTYVRAYTRVYVRMRASAAAQRGCQRVTRGVCLRWSRRRPWIRLDASISVAILIGLSRNFCCVRVFVMRNICATLQNTSNVATKNKRGTYGHDMIR